MARMDDVHLRIGLEEESYLYCGSERVSDYLALSEQYIEVNAATNKLSRWKNDQSSVIGDGDSNGQARKVRAQKLQSQSCRLDVRRRAAAT